MIVVSVLRSSSNAARRRGGIENDRQWLDIEHDQIGGVFRDVWIGGEHRRDRLADIAHGVLRQCVLPVRLERGQSRQPEADRRDVRDVGKGPHRMHAGKAQCRARIDVADFSMRHGRAHNAHMPLAGEIDVGGEAALAGQQRAIFEPRNRAADELARRRHFARICCAAARTALMMFW